MKQRKPLPAALPGGGIRWLGLASCLALGLSAPAWAGSITAESIWDRSNAIQRARSQLPPGAVITRTECTEVNVRSGNYRYICTVYFNDPAPAPAPTPSAPSAPAP